MESFAWRVAQTAFRVDTTRGWREKAFGSFTQFNASTAVHARYTSGYPGQDESCPAIDRRRNFVESRGLLVTLGKFYRAQQLNAVAGTYTKVRRRRDGHALELPVTLGKFTGYPRQFTGYPGQVLTCLPIERRRNFLRG